MRYRLRTLLILLAIGPPVVVWAGWIAREYYLSHIAAPELYFREMQWIPPFLLYPPQDHVPAEDEP